MITRARVARSSDGQLPILSVLPRCNCRERISTRGDAVHVESVHVDRDTWHWRGIAVSAANDVVLYDGPSMIDGGPIVVILTWHSTNRKTGGACSASGPRQCVAGRDCMAQTWILRSDADPVESLAADTDASICGSCASWSHR